MVRIERGLLTSDLDRFREIFFLTSSRTRFDSPEEQERFFERWTGYYLRSEPESLWVARDEAGDLAGYLTGCKDTRKAPSATHALWEDLFARFPAHFHINCHPRTQGSGVGTKLVNHFVDELSSGGIPGVFVVTEPEAENKRFYSKNGFSYEQVRLLGGRPLLFMGRGL